MPQFPTPYHLRVLAKPPRTAVMMLTLAIALIASCKSHSKEACAKACEHATNIVFDLISIKGAVTSEALEARSEAMQVSCVNECKTGELDPKCLMGASSYESLQKCSKAPEKPPGSPPGDAGDAPLPP